VTTGASSDARITVANVVRLPRRFAARDDVSMFTLLVESGYLVHHAAIDPAVIRESLVREVGCVDDWMTYSYNKRTVSGWYCCETEEGGFVVGYAGGTGEKGAPIVYSDRLEACAHFIKNELEEMRRLG
jgi:hypothetical protein